MARNVPLNTSAQVVLDADGNGQVSIGPTSQGETWLAGFTAGVLTEETSVTSEAQCRVFCGGKFIGGTTWGSTGDASTNTTQLSTGQVVMAQWTGGDPGATAKLDITGTRSV